MFSSAMKNGIGSFEPLQQSNFAIYLSGQTISLIGTWLQITAQGWLVWELSRSVAALGWVAALAALPLLVLAPFAGVIADRFNRRKLLIGTQSVAMLLAFVLALLVQTRLAQLWHIYMLALALGIVTALDLTATQAFIGDLAGMVLVRKSVTLYGIIFQVSRILGAALAGLVISALGIVWSFWLNGLSFLPVIASLMIVRAHQLQRPNQANPLRDFATSLSFIRTESRLVDLLALAMLSAFFGLPVMSILAAFASGVLHGGPPELGWLLAASGAGALLSVVFVVPLVNGAKQTGMAIALTALWMGIWFFLTSQMTILPLATLTVLLGSMGGPAVITAAMGLSQLMSPADMRARIVSLFIMVGFGIQPIASLWIGYLAQWFGVSLAILLNGLCLCIGTAFILLVRSELRVWSVAQRVE